MPRSRRGGPLQTPRKKLSAQQKADCTRKSKAAWKDPAKRAKRIAQQKATNAAREVAYADRRAADVVQRRYQAAEVILRTIQPDWLEQAIFGARP